jgi:hypothetical protein
MNVKVKLIGCINCKEVEPKKIPSKKHCSTNSRENIENQRKCKLKQSWKKPQRKLLLKSFRERKVVNKIY